MKSIIYNEPRIHNKLSCPLNKTVTVPFMFKILFLPLGSRLLLHQRFPSARPFSPLCEAFQRKAFRRPFFAHWLRLDVIPRRPLASSIFNWRFSLSLFSICCVLLLSFVGLGFRVLQLPATFLCLRTGLASTPRSPRCEKVLIRGCA